MSTAADLVAALLDAHNRRDTRALVAAYAAGATIHRAEATEPITAGEWLETRDAMVESFPDLTFTPGRVATAGSAIMFEIRITGTNHGRLHLNDSDRALLRTDAPALPPTGLAMSIDGVVVLEVEGGLITAERHFLNQAAAQEQLLLVDPARRR
jgi:hypothetical protein